MNWYKTAAKLPIPVIHPGCKVKVIDESGPKPVWKTIGEYFDAPNPIRDLLIKNNLDGAWVFEATGDKRYVTLKDLK